MAVGVCLGLSITNEDKISLHTGGSHQELPALGARVCIAIVSCSF